MVDVAAFATGMHMLGAGLGVDVTAARVEAFHLVLADRFDNSSWFEAVKRALREFKPTAAQPFPVPAFFLEPFRAATEGALDAEAGAAFERVRRATVYSAETGTWVDAGKVERMGREAYGAFLAAGGAQAFRDGTEARLSFARRDFVAAYHRLAAEREAGAAFPLADEHAAIGRGEAAALLGRVDPAGKLRLVP